MKAHSVFIEITDDGGNAAGEYHIFFEPLKNIKGNLKISSFAFYEKDDRGVSRLISKKRIGIFKIFSDWVDKKFGHYYARTVAYWIIGIMFFSALGLITFFMILFTLIFK